MNKKRASIIVGGLFAGGLIAAACTATDTKVEGTATPAAESVKAAPVAATYTAPSGAADEDRFITLLESQDFNYGGDKSLVIDTGHATCDALDRGAGVGQVISVIVSEGYSGYDAGTFLGATVYALCDEHVPTVEAFLDEFGGQ
ncbi:DUF732 domain-containing protein [Rhodococcus sp. SJ-2]